MTYQMDSEVASGLSAPAAQIRTDQTPKRGDWQTLRDRGNAMHALWASGSPPYASVKTKSFFTQANDGAKIQLRWYEKAGSKPGSAVVYAHGGGMILSDIDKYDCVVSDYVATTGVPFLSVNYRLAPESHGRMLAEDTFAGLSWLLEHRILSHYKKDPARREILRSKTSVLSATSFAWVCSFLYRGQNASRKDKPITGGRPKVKIASTHGKNFHLAIL